MSVSKALVTAALAVALAFSIGCSAPAPRPTASAPVSVPATVAPEPSAAPTLTVPPAFAAFATALQAEGVSIEVTGTAWYPAYIPAGFVVASIETTELDSAQQSGQVCDIEFKNGTKRIFLSQGSPVMRDYEIIPESTVPWGSAEAFVMKGTGTPPSRFIVYVDGLNLGELSGDVSIAELRKMAASMQAVR